MNDSKQERFRRLAERRVNRVIKDLRLIGNLSNRNNYDYTTDQIAKILTALKRELRELGARFEDRTFQHEKPFEL
jgi:hypothetical protein